jgi:hypothetical protein
VQEVIYQSFDINKSIDNGDGTITVYGMVSDDTLDYDKQICDPTWLSKALTNWFEASGNIREQHGSVAAGKALSLEQKGKQWWLKALIVDPNTVLKVKLGVLKEFSIGIRMARLVKDAIAKGGRIVDGMIGEVSLVDRGANMNAKFVIAKSLEGENKMTLADETIDPATGLPVVPPVIETVEPVVDTPAVDAVVEPVVEAPAVVETPAVDAVVETPAAVAEEVALSDELKAFILKSITEANAESSAEVSDLKKALADTETKLTDVLNKARTDGPKRTAPITDGEIAINKARDYEREVMRLRNEADRTSDLALAKSYNARADIAQASADEIRKTL